MNSWLDRGAEWLYDRVEHWRKGYVWLLIGIASWAIVIVVLTPIVCLIKLVLGKW